MICNKSYFREFTLKKKYKHVLYFVQEETVDRSDSGERVFPDDVIAVLICIVYSMMFLHLVTYFSELTLFLDSAPWQGWSYSHLGEGGWG